MEFDFAAILLGLTVLFGVVWLLDRLFLYKKRKARLDAAGEEYRDPVPVDWARSLFPVVLVVLLLRSFVAEPFRIPSGSMMPTLDVGDFILVNKFAYGLRLPAFNNKILDLGEPKRGDVVVFRWPGYTCHQADGTVVHGGNADCSIPVPSQNWIKRVIGLPGDVIQVKGNQVTVGQVTINGKPVKTEEIGPYVGNPARPADEELLAYGATIWKEQLPRRDGKAVNHLIARMPGRILTPLVPNARMPSVVPKGCYLVMGDDRDNSEDSRWWGCMPEQDLAGKAFLIWMSWKGWGTGGVDFSRIGTIVR